MNLTPAQTVALNNVTEAADAYRNAKSKLRAELLIRLEAELSALRTKRDTAAFLAYREGIPKRKIGLIGLSTSDPKTPAEVIEAGRAILGGSVQDVAVRDTLIAAAQPEPEPYVHPVNKYVLANPRPFGVSDDPEYPFTISTPDGVVIPFRAKQIDGGRPIFEFPPVYGDYDVNLPELGRFLNAPANVDDAVRLRDAAVAFMADVAARENS